MLTVRVKRKTVEAVGISTLELVGAEADGEPLPAFSAGSHIDVHLPNGLVRQYSLCSAPADASRYLIGVLRDERSRGGSAAVHEQVQEGDVLRVSPPRNHFALAPEATEHLLLGRGIGVTPLLAMAEQLDCDGASFALHYCARSPERAAFRSRLGASAFADRVHFHFDDGDEGQKLALAGLLGDRLSTAGTHLYVCGPQGFMDAVIACAQQLGWPGDRLHTERFGAAPAAQGADTAFDVRIASTGQVIPVRADQCVTDALAAHGVRIETSCEQGVCGTCLTRVIEGVPDHHDHYLSAQERLANDQFLPCCSRARTAMLVLDL